MRISERVNKLASKNFFCKGNLLALRELALRRTADRVLTVKCKRTGVSAPLGTACSSNREFAPCVWKQESGARRLSAVVPVWPRSLPSPGTLFMSKWRQAKVRMSRQRQEALRAGWPRISGRQRLHCPLLALHRHWSAMPASTICRDW